MGNDAIRAQLEALGVTGIPKKGCAMDLVVKSKWPTTRWRLPSGADWQAFKCKRLTLPARDDSFAASLSNDLWRCFAIGGDGPYGLVVRRSDWEHPNPPVQVAVDDVGRKFVQGAARSLSDILDHLEAL